MAGRDSSVLCLFDVDGTLTPARQKIIAGMGDFLQDLKKKVVVGLVGGSDFAKIAEQMGGGDYILQNFDYVFTENGLVAYKDGKLIGKESIQSYMGEETLQKFLNFSLKYMSELWLPVKSICSSVFADILMFIHHVVFHIIFLLHIIVIDSQKEKIREKFVEALRKEFSSSGLVFSIGGQISIDAFPKGWDKTYCLNHLKDEGFKTIHFFGDKTSPGGNDHEIFADSRTIGHSVKGPDDTRNQVEELFFKN
uniref:Phosphomannomutase n=1 Tax=Saccoglossus kowalevskii TaxID=10224 RepID=A0ABM0GPP4_SACKO|nr:PREDICTED: phosphomannomutase 1-like [Saccoglossus kowalevskii]